MTHPDPAANPHTGVDEDGNPVTLHVTTAGIAPADDTGGEPPSASQTGQGGTALSTSSTTAETPDASTGSSTPKPAPDAENPSASDRTTASTASSTAGDGTEPQTGPTRQSGPADEKK